MLFEPLFAGSDEMSKLIGLAFAITVLLLVPKPRSNLFSKYKTVEAYEIRPGILAMPRYATNGQVCEVRIQKDLDSSGTLERDPTLPGEIITQIFDELAPQAERGSLTSDPELARLSVYFDNGVTSSYNYKNVSLDISREASSRGGDVVAVITWKNRACK